ncbi:MAG: triose-phosphate isomerase [Rickettsiales bacterium TMED131]|nr:MAG: triose-phosphate isomerase [Rickettsiales bacterium TMED131]
MNKSFDDGLKTILEINKEIKNNRRKKYIFLPPVQSTLFLKNYISDNRILFGSQNCSHFNNGAYTGEISAEMIKKIGCKYILIGHSERRGYFNEQDDVLFEKVRRANEQNLKVIFCVGESIDNYNKNISAKVIIQQLSRVFDKTTKFKNLLIAYEPIWAIGSSKTPKMNEIENIHLEIKKIMKKKYKLPNIPVLYGGSVNSKNSSEIFSLKSVDGGLIGGASLIASEFCKIYDTL